MDVNVTTNHELRYCCSVQPLSFFFLFLAGGKKKSDTGAPFPVSSASEATDHLLLGFVLGLASARAATNAGICLWPEGTIRESFFRRRLLLFAASAAAARRRLLVAPNCAMKAVRSSLDWLIDKMI